jgi:hypothetical protein
LPESPREPERVVAHSDSRRQRTLVVVVDRFGAVVGVGVVVVVVVVVDDGIGPT